MYTLTATDLKKKFLDGDISAEKITQYYLNRIQTLDPKIGSFLKVLEERSLNKARLLDQKRKEGKPLGKLAGVPIAIKDNIHIQNELTTCASKFLSNYVAPFSATCVEELEKEDAILIGKTNLDEFAMGSSTEKSSFQLTHNPWDLSCIPGGSSGGSAACVAARLCPLSLGSDTGGSIRQPAALTGIIGYKPSYGRVSRYGLVAFASSLDQIGPFATSVEDIALSLEVMGKPCHKDATHMGKPPEEYTKLLKKDLNGVRIGIPWAFLEGLPEETLKNFKASIAICKELGATTLDVHIDHLKASIAVYYVIATAEASTNLARFDGIRYGIRSDKALTLDEVYTLSRQEGFGKEVKLRIMLGTYVLASGFQNAYYKKAQKVRNLIIEGFNKAYQACDVIAMPCSPMACIKLGTLQDPLQTYLLDIFTLPANLAGLPAISLPSGFSASKHPLSLSFMGAHGEDALLLSIAHAFSSKTPFAQQIPPLFDKSVTG